MSNATALPKVVPARSYTSLVVGTDFTPCSAVALREAMRVASWAQSRLHVVHVIDTTVVVELETVLSDFQRAIQENLERDARKAWATFSMNVPGAGRLPFDVAINNRIYGILNHARTHQADLLVMGAFGERRPDVGFGTVATACVRKSMTDVLLVRDTLAAPFKVIVAAVDFSDTSARALARAAWVAAQDGAELHVLHVFAAPWQGVAYSDVDPSVPLHLQQQYREAIEQRLTDFVAPVADAHRNLRLRTVCSDLGRHRSGIVDYAKRASADLIVLGTRGRTNLRDILLGSTAEKALAESHCSVLAVKPEGFEHPLAKDAQPQAVQLRPPC